MIESIVMIRVVLMLEYTYAVQRTVRLFFLRIERALALFEAAGTFESFFMIICWFLVSFYYNFLERIDWASAISVD